MFLRNIILFPWEVFFVRKKYGNVVWITTAALLVALEIVLNRFGSINTMGLKIGLAFIPPTMAAIMFGPATGALVWALSDLLGAILFPSGPYHPGFTACAALMGLVSGLLLCREPVSIRRESERGRFIFDLSRKKVRIFPNVVAAVAVNCLILGLTVNTAWISMLYGKRTYLEWFLFRLGEYAVLVPVQIVVIPILIKLCDLLSRQFARRGARGPEKMTYDEALSYIHSVSWKGSRPGLERIRELCRLLGDPQRGMKFVHVAGTNGKGSVCAMTASVLRASGLKTGLFTSPYVSFFEERIQVDGEPIPKDRLAEVTAKVKRCADKMEDSPTEFELLTAIGFVYFREAGCDVVVLEVGLGGRLDSTNVIEDPVLSVITGIDLDHTEVLGSTLGEIAAEKGGIIKPGRPVVVAGCPAEAEEVLRRIAEERGSEFIPVDYSRISGVVSSLDGSSFDLAPYGKMSVSLAGIYQIKNAAVVVTAVEAIREQGFSVTDENLAEGLASAKWPARFETLSRDPLVIYDGAHNPNGVAALCENIRTLCGGRVILVTGVMADKDYRPMAEELSPLTEKVFTVTPGNPRALDAEKLAGVYAAAGADAVPCVAVDEGVRLAAEEGRRTGLPVVISGTLYMYAEAAPAVRRICGME